MSRTECTSNHSRVNLKLTVLIVLSILAFSTRVVPYSFSSLPFNNDGMTEARIAEDILLIGHLSFPDESYYADTYSVVTPAYNTMLAFSSSVIGIDTYTLAQSLVAVFAVLTVVAGYTIALRISRDITGALSAALVLALLGTFVFLTGSAWKGSLGVAMLVLLIFAFINRSDRRFLLLELVVLVSLPLAYHLVTILAYLLLAYLTLWSVLMAFVGKRISSSHLIDLSVICVASFGAYLYYLNASFQRLSEYGSMENLILMLLVFLTLVCSTGYVFIRKNSLSFSFAPVAGTVVVIVVFIDYYDPIFPYVQGYFPSVVMLGFIYALIVAFGWFGFELLARSNSRYRSIPFGVFLPVPTLFLVTMLSGLDLEVHKVFYRTFDYADIGLAFGIAVVAASLSKPRLRIIFSTVLLLILICSFPFAYATATLLGDRHDSQEFEVDALTWIRESVDDSTQLRSDERIAYNARALFDFGKDPSLPSRLVSGDPLSPSIVNVLLEEWMTVGVNDYPRGHPILDECYVNAVLTYSNVLYIGGPASCNMIVFQTTIVG